MKFFYRYGRSFFRYLTILFLVLLQIACMVLFVYFLRDSALIVYVAIEVLSMFILIPLLADSRNAAYKLYWMTAILMLPIVGHIMYQLWGKDKVNRREHKKIQTIVNNANLHQTFDEKLVSDLHEKEPEKWKIANYLYQQGYPLYDHTKLEYFSLGELAFEDMIIELEKAKQFVFMSFFTIAEGVVFHRICEVLEKKVQQGVEVKILYDDAGSVFQLADETVDELRRVGVEIIRFNPVERNYYHLFLNYRNHQKIVVVDGLVAYTGGINASDRYANINSPYGHWKDVAIKLRGDAVWSMSLTFLAMWEASGKAVDYDKYKTSVSVMEGGLCLPFADGPSNNPENEAVDLYRHMIQEANKEVYITTPYLILDDIMRDTLCLAAKSGVDIRIITPGIPDKKKAKLLTEWNYGTLLKSGVRIYEYTPGFMHAKMCINDFSCILGTINMDFRSFFIHYENAVWSSQREIIDALKSDYMETLKACHEVTLEEWKSRPMYKKIHQYILQIFKCQF